MSYTSPTTSDKDYVRFLVGDTSNDAAVEAFTDAEIVAMLALQYGQGDGKVFLTAVTCLQALKAKYIALTEGLKSRKIDEISWTFGTPVGMDMLIAEYQVRGNLLNQTKPKYVRVLGKV